MNKKDWKKIAEREFKAMDKEWQNEWRELRNRTR
jgi:hypothetical protein